MRILILIGGHLSTAPRPQKEADELARRGHEVHIAGVWFDPRLVARDRQLLASVPYKFSSLSPDRGAARLWQRARRALALRAPWLRLPERFGTCPLEMVRHARRLRPDLVIAHSEAALWAASQLRRDGFTVGVDMEDWFSRDLPEAARRRRPVAELEHLERDLLANSTYALATSQAMAAALAQAYRVPRPVVVRNVFPLDSPPPPRSWARPRVHWFSQTIGPGRGLELLFSALPSLEPRFDIVLRGDLPHRYRPWVEAAVPGPWRPHLRIEETVPSQELHSAIGRNDIGLALETAAIPSRDLTITNKLFQYLNAGLAVIATRTAGQVEAMAGAPGAGLLIREDPTELADALHRFTSDEALLAESRAHARLAAEQCYCWELERDRLPNPP
jgi:glycosyltransferase involved in cell wall biosynthesis